MPQLFLSSSVSQLSRVGQTVSGRLRLMGIETIEDLLHHFPFRYEDLRKQQKIADLQPDTVASLHVRLLSIRERRGFRRVQSITEAIVSDDTGELPILWFNQSYLSQSLKIGEELFLSGKVKYGRSGLTLLSPQYEKKGNAEEQQIHTAGIVPIYSVTANITQKQIRFLVKQALEHLRDLPPDWLPEAFQQRYGLCSLAEAFEMGHFPKDWHEMETARKRLKFNELFLLQAQNELLKKDMQKFFALQQRIFTEKIRELVQGLSFQLTDSQRKASWKILQNLSEERPMNRLLQGDVGSGKTVVSALAIFNTALNGYQTALMAPTEILADQHFATFLRLFDGKQIAIAHLSRNYAEISQGKGETVSLKRDDLFELIASGKVDLIIGTHALLREDVTFQKLGFVIIDEQHRFGVEQRKLLREKMLFKSDTSISSMPHLLSMTATPIPRTLSLTLYGDLDISVMKDMPPGRKPVSTKLVREAERVRTYGHIAQELQAGRQCYVICPLIEESDILGVVSVKQEHEKLKKVFISCNIGLLHGKMKAKEKERVMQEFKEGRTQMLISTSVVEVGVDVPNATVMLIEGAERFGLAQLHQFRGRVGRGEYASYCFVFPEHCSKETYERLRMFEQCLSGFELAQKDLEMRGPGEFYGRVQSGLPELSFATLGDSEIIAQASEAAKQIIDKDGIGMYPVLQKLLESKIAEVHLE